jgi:hypothetical protein
MLGFGDYAAKTQHTVLFLPELPITPGRQAKNRYNTNERTHTGENDVRHVQKEARPHA